MIVVPALKVGFQGVPKVGTTSVYLWLFDLCVQMDKGGLQHAKRGREYFVRGEDGNLQLENEENAIAPYGDYFKFGFYRDPVKRFVSMYRNRVVYHRELSPKSKAAPELERNGLGFNPQLNEMVANLKLYMESAKSIDHHARPQIDFIGPDTSVYNRLVDIKEMNNVLEELRGHWQGLGLEVLARHNIALGREQTGGPKLGLEALSQESFEQLVEFYRADYQAFPSLSVDAVRDEYKAALASKPAAGPVVFWERNADGNSPPAKPKEAPPKETGQQAGKAGPTVGARINSGPAPASAAAKSAPGTLSAAAAAPKTAADAADDGQFRLALQKQVPAEVALLRADFPRATIGAGEFFAFGGQCLLKPDHKVADYALRIRWPGHIRDCLWELASPGLAEKYPKNENASRARFKLTGVSLQRGERAELLLRRKESTDERVIAILQAEIPA